MKTINLKALFTYLSPVLPESDRALFEQDLTYINIIRLRIIAWLLIVIMLILIVIQLTYIGKIVQPLILKIAPYIMLLRLVIIGVSVIFLVLSKPPSSQNAITPFHHFCEYGFTLFNLIAFAVLTGLIHYTGFSFASSYIMAVLVSATLIYLDWRKSIIVYSLSWIIMSIMIWSLQPDWVVAFSSFLNGTFATVLAFVISRMIYLSRVSEFLNQQIINQQKEELSVSNDNLKRLTYMDALTGIPNRRYFNEFLTREWRRAVREKKSICLIMIDVDKFKMFNDSFGHQAGDRAMVQIATSLSDTIKRPGDLVARYGGEEFTAILPDTELSGARQLAERMLKSVEKLNISHPFSPTGRITISLGLVNMRPGEKELPEDLIGSADKALYQAKEAGGNQYALAVAVHSQ
ncbi:MAG: diguanylate cyclase [Bacillota bacterium]